MNEISHENLLESLFDGVYYVDRNRKITVWNAAAERITGFTKAEVLGHCCADNILRHIDEQGHELCVEGCPLAACMQDGKVRETTIYLHHKQGHRVPATVRVSPVRDAAGGIIGCVEVFSDNSSAQQIIHELESLKKEVYLDSLTGVGNRRYAEMILKTRFYEWQTHGVPYGVIFLDIDYFKRFNDTYGHKTGDEVLTMVSKTMTNLLRRMDAVARWGGEEFVVILQNINGAFLKDAAERLRIFIERSFLMVAETPLTVTASLGVTLVCPTDTQESVVARADQLMYASKTAGRNRVTCG
jgi:diguanylate cyclase (GGDEF)-like protein/PAS domain S-box-containing protein